MKLKSIYIALGLSLLLTGCKSEEPAPQAKGEVNLPVSFTIQLAIESQNTRSGDNDGIALYSDSEGAGTWEDDEKGEYDDGEITDDSGTNFDNTINSIIPVLYFVTGNEMKTTYPVAQMVDQRWEKVEGKDGEFKVTGTLKSSNWSTDMLTDPQYKYRIALFINCGKDDVMSPLNINTPAQATFNHHGKPDDCRDENSKHFHGIPMYGVGEVKFVVDESADDPTRKYKILGNNDQELNINILRSMAKVRVKLSDDLAKDEKINLTELYISRHAIKGFVVPKGWNTTSDVASLTNGLAMNAFTGAIKDDYNHDCYVRPQTKDNDYNGVNGDQHEGDKDYYANTSELLRFYLPDTYNCDHDGIDDSDEIYLRLSYTVEDQEYTHLLWFRPVSEWPSMKEGEYSDDGTINYPKTGTPWDIIRNHIYEFVIEGVEDNFGLKVAVNVKKWDYRKIETEL
ncbi:MAG: hypothetical protein K2M53_08005 [Muribaculaceae bacterium]|nr:hypothetical protein [Muribaculaceae bacterium]